MPRGGDRTAKAIANGKRVGRPPRAKQLLTSEQVALDWMRARLKRWKISPADFHRQLDEQQGRCAVCAELLTDGWVVDHDHMTLRVRGLLHQRCNALLGMAKDDPLRLERAAAYLRKHNKYLGVPAENEASLFRVV